MDIQIACVPCFEIRFHVKLICNWLLDNSFTWNRRVSGAGELEDMSERALAGRSNKMLNGDIVQRSRRMEGRSLLPEGIHRMSRSASEAYTAQRPLVELGIVPGRV